MFKKETLRVTVWPLNLNKIIEWLKQTFFWFIVECRECGNKKKYGKSSINIYIEISILIIMIIVGNKIPLFKMENWLKSKWHIEY